MTGGKVRQYPYFVGLFHTFTPLRSVELSKKWRNSGFHGQGWTWLLKGGKKKTMENYKIVTTKSGCGHFILHVVCYETC